jgi:hypothetical protein
MASEFPAAALFIFLLMLSLVVPQVIWSSRDRLQDHLRRLLAEMKVSGVELSCLSQSVPILDDDRSFVRFDEPVAPQFLHGPVHVHRGEASRIGEFRLSDRQRIAVSVGQSKRL